jgi:hypothetical protein
MFAGQAGGAAVDIGIVDQRRHGLPALALCEKLVQQRIGAN